MNAPTPWLLLQHVDFEGPAAWATDLAERGIALEVCRLWAGDPVPDASEVGDGARLGGVLVMGGPMSADDDAEVAHLAHLAAERALLADVVAREVPVIGVCLGSQLTALALGASLDHGVSPEYGIGPVEAGEGDLAARVAAAPVLHWHADAHGLPPGAQRLASTAVTPTQGFVVHRAVGLQFHVELRPQDLAVIGAHLPPELVIDAAELAALQEPWAKVRAAVLDRVL